LKRILHSSSSSAALRISAAPLLVVTLVALSAACRRDMQDQPRFRPFRSSSFFTDGRSERPLVPGTVARGRLDEDELFHTGKVAGKPAETFPFAVTAEILARGRDRYDIFCAPCHGRVGDGDGAVVERGMRRPPSFHVERLVKAPPGYFVDVVANGFGAMFDQADRIDASDRWAIAAYVRALQRSQNAKLEDVPQAERAQLTEAR
jgi:mono/diheme cytochrome c family protein